MSDLTADQADSAEVTDAARAQQRIVVNGLEMAVGTWGRILAAVRGLFPAATAGLSDSAAVQAVMKHVLIEWVSTWEGRQAGPDPSDAARQAQAAAVAVQQDAADRARKHVVDDVQPTITS
jgi:hypothetical protein